ncbi:hypothetical protein K438DRAFT_1989073 [Mycena galopus ATCC 62051]|nr:hypothetical protein K438DRAFT_1989073 [Mycena galopus ATCC 62051]
MSESTNATAHFEPVDDAHVADGVNTSECQYQELKRLTSALARDHGELHAHFTSLATDFKELAAEYENLYAEYDTLVEEHEALATKHEALATKYQRLRALHVRTTVRSRQTPINTGLPPSQMATLTSPAVEPVLTTLVDVPQERCRRAT